MKEKLLFISLFVSEDLYAKKNDIKRKPRLDGAIIISEISKKEKRE